MSAELFEKKKRGRPAKEKLVKTKLQKNKEELKEMTTEIVEEKVEKVRKSNLIKHTFKCAEIGCGIQVTLEGDDPTFMKRTKCYHHQ